MKKRKETYSLYCKGKRGRTRAIYVERQPSFFDALQLSKGNNTFEEIPITKDSSMNVYITENNMGKIICNFELPEYMSVKDPDKCCCEELAGRILSCFLIKRGNEVLYLLQRPPRGVLKRKRKVPHVLNAYIKEE